MTKTLERAFDRASKLPARDQNAIAKWLLAELESEKKWQAAFRHSTASLGQLADEALSAHRAGKTKRLDPEQM